MKRDSNTTDVAAAIRTSLGLLVRRLRQARGVGELTLPETSALARLDRGGPTTPGALAKLEQISPQSMGSTLAGLEERGLIERASDAEDGRRVIFTLTEAGLRVLRDRRNEGTELLAAALTRDFTASEIEQLRAAAPLLERLAQSI